MVEPGGLSSASGGRERSVPTAARARRAGLLLIAVVGLVLAAPHAAPAAADGDELHVMSFNLRFASDTPPNSWPERRPVMRDLLLAEAPELIGTQEGLDQQLRDIEADLPTYYDSIGQGREGGSQGEAMQIFYDTRRLEPLEHGHYWLSDTPDVVGSQTWGGCCPRMVTWIRFLDLDVGTQLYAVNTHFEAFSPFARARSTDLVLERLGGFDPNLPVIVTGDFNEPARGPETGLQLSSGALRLELLQGDMSPTANTAQNVILRDAPDGAWTLTTRIDVSGLDLVNDQAGLLAWRGESPHNFAKLVFRRLTAGGTGQFRIERLNAVDGGAGQGNGNTGSLPGGPESVYLRMTSDGGAPNPTITTHYSLDGAEWSNVTAPFQPGGEGPLRIGLVAARSTSGGGFTSPRYAGFDTFRTQAGSDPGEPLCEPDGGDGACLPQSDEFDGDALDPDWSVLRPGPSVYERLLTGGPFVDTWERAETRSALFATFHGYQPLVPGGDRIDWILTSPVISTRTASINTHQDAGQFPSDHLPVQAVLRLPEAGEPRLRVLGRPALRTVGSHRARARYRLLATNVGDSPSGVVHLCARAPRARIAIVGRRCVEHADIPASETRRRALRIRIKRGARGRLTRIGLLVRGPAVVNQRTVVRLRVRG